MASRSYSASNVLDDYSNLRTVPALLSVFYVFASLFQFGGIDPITFNWISYTIQPQHAVLGSIAVFAVAFMSSETKSFERYSQEEQALIVAGPGIILTYEFVPFVTNFLNGMGDLGMIVAFLITVASWGAAVR
jgi:hypothetical protein